ASMAFMKCADRIGLGFSRVYQAHFMKAMLAYVQDKQRLFGEQRAVPSGFAQVLEQHVAAQRIADRVQRRLRAPGAQ
ncbi:hypothetical protein ACV340_31270, partial [Pseudomonas aeruginosa]